MCSTVYNLLLSMCREDKKISNQRDLFQNFFYLSFYEIVNGFSVTYE